MANKLYNDTSIKAIADAIRAKNDTTATYTIGEMANAITNISANLFSAEVTFPSRLRNGIVLTLPGDVLAHKDDADFLMTYQFQGTALVAYRSYFGAVGNRKVMFDTDYYGAYYYNNTTGSVYYPINSADNTFSHEGVYKIKFYIDDGKLYIAEDMGAGFDAGTYKFTFTW